MQTEQKRGSFTHLSTLFKFLRERHGGDDSAEQKNIRTTSINPMRRKAHTEVTLGMSKRPTTWDLLLSFYTAWWFDLLLQQTVSCRSAFDHSA